MHIDIRSLLFILMLATTIEWLAMLFVWLFRKTYPGFGLWTAGNAVFAAAFLLLGLRGIIPDFLSIILANILIIGAAVLHYEGTLRFRQWTSQRVFGIALIVIMTVTVLYFRYVDDNIRMRIITLSLLLAVIYGLVTLALLLELPSGRRTTYWLTASFFAIHSGFLLVRIVATALNPDIRDLFAPNWLQPLTFLLPLLTNILWTFCFLILNSERIEMDLMVEIEGHRTAEETLAKSEEKYRLLMETLPLAVFVDTNGRIVYVNPAFVTLFKASAPDELIGARPSDFFHPDLIDKIERGRRIMQETMRPLPHLEINLRCLDESFITAVVTPMPILFQGQPSILTVLYDITARKRDEIELEKARKLLQFQGREIEELRVKLTAQGIDP